MSPSGAGHQARTHSPLVRKMRKSNASVIGGIGQEGSCLSFHHGDTEDTEIALKKTRDLRTTKPKIVCFFGKASRLDPRLISRIRGNPRAIVHTDGPRIYADATSMRVSLTGVRVSQRAVLCCPGFRQEPRRRHKVATMRWRGPSLAPRIIGAPNIPEYLAIDGVFFTTAFSLAISEADP